jgi:hypothetical protein
MLPLRFLPFSAVVGLDPIGDNGAGLEVSEMVRYPPPSWLVW